MLTPGDVFAGKYRVDRILGQGGMGVVIGATHLHTHDRVALKFLLPEASEQPMVRARFMNEARAAVQIKSEHVARVTDVDMAPDGTPYMVMEYLEGQDLAALLASGGPLSPQTATDHLLQACEALSEAHALGIVHRDLKPGNLFLTHRKDGSDLVKVLDFGISKLGTGPDARLTRTRGVMGSPLYMSPEQLTRPKDVDARSDIWSLGVVLFELLTGAWPFDAATMEGLAVEIVTAPPRAIRDVRPDLPVAVDEIVRRCLEKRPDQRFPSVAELAVALVPLGSARATHSAERISRVLSSSPRIPSPAAKAVTIDPITVPAPARAFAPTVAPTVAPIPVLQRTDASWAATKERLVKASGAEVPARRNPLPMICGGLALAVMASLFLALRSDPARSLAQTGASALAAATPPPSATASPPTSAASTAPTLAPVASSVAPSPLAVATGVGTATSTARAPLPVKTAAKPSAPYGLQ